MGFHLLSTFSSLDMLVIKRVRLGVLVLLKPQHRHLKIEIEANLFRNRQTIGTRNGNVRKTCCLELIVQHSERRKNNTPVCFISSHILVLLLGFRRN